MRLYLLGATALASLMAAAASVRAEEPPTFRTRIKNHAFDPAEITVPAGKRLVLIVHNADDTPAEFESQELGAEKVISAGRDATVRIGPLAAGRYPFVDDFHQDQARGALIAAGEQ